MGDTMRKSPFLVALTFVVMLGSMSASEARASSISGEIFFTGSAVLKLGAANSTFALADGIDFTNPIQILEAISTGDYAGLAAATTATFTDLVGGSAFGVVGTTGPLAVDPLWTFVDGGLTYEFNLSTVISNAVVAGARVIEGSGTATITGFDPTPGYWQLSTSGRNATVSFSSVATVPDGGATVAFLGLALLGISVVRAKLKV